MVIDNHGLFLTLKYRLAQILDLLTPYLQRHKNRIVGLDLLRTIAILLVMFYHAGLLLPIEAQTAYFKALPIKLDGVSVFFVLSGYLIGGILLKELNKTQFDVQNLWQFWLRRWFRTLPNYFMVLSLLVFYRLYNVNDLGEFNAYFYCFSQNLFGPHPKFFPEAWSLSVEEWFYLLFPLLCFLVLRMLGNVKKSMFTTLLLFLIVPFALRVLKYHFGEAPLGFDLEYRKVVYLRLDSIMYGILGAFAHYYLPMFWKRERFKFLGAGFILLILFSLNPNNWRNYYEPLVFNLESVIVLCFLPYLSLLKSTKLKVPDSLVIFISIISYSMYLLNLTIVQGIAIPKINDFLQFHNPNINFLMYWIITISASFLLYRFFENPMTRLRERFAPKN